MISSCLCWDPMSDIAVTKLPIRNTNFEGPLDRLGEDLRPHADWTMRLSTGVETAFPRSSKPSGEISVARPEIVVEFAGKIGYRNYYVNDYNGPRSMVKPQKPTEPDLGRFSDPALVVLTCIADGPKHGYAILQESESLGFPLSLGTLYGALNRLERLGLVEPLPSVDRRRPYRLTKTGAGHLKARLNSLIRVVRYGSRKLERAW